MNNNKEFETKVLKIDPVEIADRLRVLGATETPEYLMRRAVFDIKDKNGIKIVRVRDENGKVTLTYKYKPLGNKKIGVTKEIEVEVSDFDKTRDILSQVPFNFHIYQENRVHIFNLKGIEFSIATWPMIDPYLEVEASSEKKVLEGLKLLGLEGKDVGDMDIAEIYGQKGIVLNDIKVLKFE